MEYDINLCGLEGVCMMPCKDCTLCMGWSDKDSANEEEMWAEILEADD